LSAELGTLVPVMPAMFLLCGESVTTLWWMNDGLACGSA
jgi:hypothetical protein